MRRRSALDGRAGPFAAVGGVTRRLEGLSNPGATSASSRRDRMKSTDESGTARHGARLYLKDP